MAGGGRLTIAIILGSNPIALLYKQGDGTTAPWAKGSRREGWRPLLAWILREVLYVYMYIYIYIDVYTKILGWLVGWLVNSRLHQLVD